MDEARTAPRELDVRETPGGAGAVQRDDERLAAEAGDHRREEPVRVHEVRTGGRAPYRPPHREEHERRRPRATAQVRRNPAAVREAEIPIPGAGSEHLHLRPALAQPLDGVSDEAARELPLRPRPRGRDDDDAHYSRARAPNTTGRASAKARKA